MTKILFVITKDDVGGAQKYVKDLVESLDPKKFEIKILTGGKGGVRFLSNVFWPHLLFVNDIAALLELIFKLRKEKPEIIHLNSSKAGVIGAIAAKLAGVPRVIFTAHGWVFNPDNDFSFWRRRFYILLHKLAALFQDKIINVSEYDRQLAMKCRIAPPEKLTTIHNGISELSFLSKKDARKAIKTISGKLLDAEAVWIGSIGRLVAEKDYRTLVETAALVPETHFIILGSGYQRKNLESKIKKLGLDNRVFIIQDIAPAAHYLKAFDVFVLSSIKEGLPYTMIEAMAAQLPIVVTRIGGMTEIISGRGLVMPPREPAELARAIKFLLDNPKEAQKFSLEASNFRKTKLNLDNMVEETEKIYES